MRRLLILTLLALPTFGQGIRIDPAPVLTTTGNPPPGGFPLLYAVPGARIGLFANAAATAPAVAYTDQTAGTPCASGSPVVAAGTSACSQFSGPQGQFGFWVEPGTYYYTITISGTKYGPYTVQAFGPAGGYTYDGNYTTLALAYAAAGSDTLFITKTWNAQASATYTAPTIFTGAGKVQAASGQTVVLKSVTAGNWAICDQSLGTVTVTSATGVYGPNWGCTVPQSIPITALTEGVVADPIPGTSSTPSPSSPVLCPGGALNMAAATVIGGQSYLISNWCFGQAGGTVNTRGTAMTWAAGVHYATFTHGEVISVNNSICTVNAVTDSTHFTCNENLGSNVGAPLLTDANDRIFRDGASCLLGFGIISPGSDIQPGQIKFMCSVNELAGDHVIWNEKLSVFGNGDPTYSNFGSRFAVPMIQTVLFTDTAATIAEPGPTALAAVLVPGTAANSVLTGDQSKHALEISVQNGRASFQARDFAGGGTAGVLQFNPLGGAVMIGTSTTPASSGAACKTGTVAWDSSYVYVCVATDTWKRTAVSTW